MTDAETTLGAALSDLGTGSLVVVTGAGISVASGIPTFRGTDPGAIWKRDVTELATFDYFQRDPAGSWRWYLERFDRVLGCQPNPAHRALVDLETWHTDRGGTFLLVSQNIDPLHERAGSERLIKVHGSAERVRCSNRGCEHGEPRGWLAFRDLDLAPFRAEATVGNLPRCPVCEGLLRPHVLWFDELYDAHADYGWEAVYVAAATADLVLFVGTSFAVGVTELFRQAARARGVPTLSIDPGAEADRLSGMTTLAEPAEEILPAVVRELVGHTG